MQKNYDGTFSADLINTFAFANAVDPNVMVCDPTKAAAAGTKAAWEAIKKTDENRKTDRRELRKELNRLMQEYFDLKQCAKGYENRINEAVGQVHLHEQKLAFALKQKKEAGEADNLLMARYAEDAIVYIERDLETYKTQLKQLHTDNKSVMARLRGFNRQRIQDLKDILDNPPQTHRDFASKGNTWQVS